MSDIKEIFQTLNAINLKDKVKDKIGLSYLSWADAWNELKKVYPTAKMNVYTRTVTTKTTVTIAEDGMNKVTETSCVDEVPYFTDGKTCYVKVGVQIDDIEYVELLPVMDNRNQAVPLATVTMTAVNKAIQRCFVKAVARFGLGLYIYSGEDLPEAERKVIDFDAIAKNCDRYQTVELSPEGFEKMKNDVIAAVQADYPQEAAKAIVDYTGTVAKGKRLSLFDLEHDSVNIQRIYNFINEVKKELAAPNGR